jgi:uncharacterized repeat protein (TIGR03803 family)
MKHPIKSFLTALCWLGLSVASSLAQGPTLNFVASMPEENARPYGSLTFGFDGNFYGMSSPLEDPATLFRITPEGEVTTLFTFTGISGPHKGREPQSHLTQHPNGSLYGMAPYGGEFDCGTLFRVDIDELGEASFTTVFDFTGTSGGYPGTAPVGSLTLGPDGYFYGTTAQGGESNGGTFFKVSSEGEFTSLHHFNPATGIHFPESTLILGKDGHFYGSSGNSSSGNGALFRTTRQGAVTTLVEFTGTGGSFKGRRPGRKLALNAEGHFYGVTTFGGASDYGTVFKMVLDETTGQVSEFTTLTEFSGSNGTNPAGGLTYSADGNLYGGSRSTIFQVTPSGAFNSLFTLTGQGTTATSGYLPRNSHFVSDGTGKLYITTIEGGADNTGAVLSLTLNHETAPSLVVTGNDTVIPSGSPPSTANHTNFGPVLIEGDTSLSRTFTITNTGDGPLLFAEAFSVVAFGSTAFTVTDSPVAPIAPGARDTFTVAFDPATTGIHQSQIFVISNDNANAGFFLFVEGRGDSGIPIDLVTSNTEADRVFDSTLTLGSDGNFYGFSIGVEETDFGTLFRMTPAGEFTTLINFTGDIGPFKGAGNLSSLVLAGNNTFYGTTMSGGAGDMGTIFKLVIDAETGAVSEFTTLLEFDETGVNSPCAKLVFYNGMIYGMTSNGMEASGNLFRVTTEGDLTILHTFERGLVWPTNGLTLGPDGNLYGTQVGGPSNEEEDFYGQVFKMTPDEEVTTVFEFTWIDGPFKGAGPTGSLTLGADGTLYGTTVNGGDHEMGTIFKIEIDSVSGEAQFTSLYSFNIDSENQRGLLPYTNVNLGIDGNLYGWASGGFYGEGIIYQLKPNGEFITLLDFVGPESEYEEDYNTAAGGSPIYGNFSADARGNLYIPTLDGGINRLGGIIRINLAAELPFYVSGNDIPISAGDTSPSEEDGTDFGEVNVGSTLPQTFTLHNTGSEELLITGIVSSDAENFTVSNVPTEALPADEGTATFTVTFAPESTGLKTATITVSGAEDGDFTFTVQGTGTVDGNAPTITTTAPTHISGYSATLNGTVTSNETAATYFFQYSIDPSLTEGVTSTATQSLPSGSSAVAVSANLSSLTPQTTYYYRLVASNEAGTSQSGIGSFTVYTIITGEVLPPSSGLPNGGSIYRPMPGVINNAGHILFQATGQVGSGGGSITGANDEWLLTDVGGFPRVILQEGSELGSGTGHFISGLYNHLLLGMNGQSMLSEKLTGATSDQDYAYLAIPTSGETVEIISQEGDVAPDTNNGIFINSVGKPAMDSEDRLYFQGSLTGISTAKASGVWVDQGEGISTLIQAGYNLSPVFAEPAWLGKVSNILAAGGDGCAFVATLQPNPDDNKQKTDTLRNQAILSVSPGLDAEPVIELIARKGDVITEGATINNITALSRSVNAGHAYIGLLKTGSGVTSSNDQVLVTVVAGESILIAREGVTELVPGLTPKSFGDFYVTASGDVIFQAVLNEAAATSDGILCRWLADSGELEVLAREGDAAPGTASLNYGTLHTVGVSDSGHIVLQVILSNGKHGLFRKLESDFELLVQAGDSVNFGGAARTVLSLGLYNKTTGTGGGGGGMGSAINDAGDVFTVLSIGNGEYGAMVYRGETPPPL